MFKLIITHSTLNINAEKRFSGDLTVRQLKEKLEMIVGTKPDNMILQHKNQNDEILCTMQPDELKISKFDLVNYSNIHVVDTRPDTGIVATLTGLQNNDKNVQVKKYEISEEAYKKRDNTFAKWKEKNLKQFYEQKEEEQKKEIEKYDTAYNKLKNEKNIKINDRCQILPSKHRGQILFIGKTEFDKKSTWIGVKLDEPYGENNGTVKGKKYFECADKYGIFVRPDAIEVGDFPEIDELELTDDDEEL